MFTGLIAATGKILSLTPTDGAHRLRVAAPTAMLRQTRTGDSIAVNGVCLTALEIIADEGIFHADLGAETLARTSLAQLAAGTLVNLEHPTPAGTPLGGHVVQGHVDGGGCLLSLEPVTAGANAATTDWWLRVVIPPAYARYAAEKGSIAIDGISLTVARVEAVQEDCVVAVNIIPHTYVATNLHTLTSGAPVNIEVDVLAKYAERLVAERAAQSPLTLAALIANGY